MKSRMLTCTIAIASFAALAVPVRLAAQEDKQGPPDYSVADLGTLGGTFSVAGANNNKGVVEGYSTLPGDTETHAFLWRKGVMTDLGTLGGPNSIAETRPSESGQAGGRSDTTTPDPNGEDFCGFGTHLICLPFLWQHGVMTPLPTLGGNNGRANSVNNRGQVVGRSETTTPDPTCIPPQVFQSKPVLWEKGSIEELPTFPGDPRGGALDINDRGQATGFSGSCTTMSHALLWQGGTVTDLGSLGGPMFNLPQAINNQGQVVGVSDLPGDTTFHAFLWQNGVMTDLGTLAGDFASLGSSINSEGQVVGGSFDIDFNDRAFLWQNGVMTDLNTLIPAGSPLFLIQAYGNNDQGQIAGYALQISTGEVHAFLATPTHGGAPSEGPAPTTQGATRERPKVVLPENVRKLLQQRLLFRGLSGGPMELQ